jgi:hypothetical protein
MSQTPNPENHYKTHPNFHDKSVFKKNLTYLAPIPTAVLIAMIGITDITEELAKVLGYKYEKKSVKKYVRNIVDGINNVLGTNGTSNTISLYAFHASQQYIKIIETVKTIMNNTNPLTSQNNGKTFKTELKALEKELRKCYSAGTTITATKDLISLINKEAMESFELIDYYEKGKNYILAFDSEDPTDITQIEIDNVLSYILVLLGILDGFKVLISPYCFDEIEKKANDYRLSQHRLYQQGVSLEENRDNEAKNYNVGNSYIISMKKDLIEHIKTALNQIGVQVNLHEHALFDPDFSSSISGGILGLGLIQYMYNQKA